MNDKNGKSKDTKGAGIAPQAPFINISKRYSGDGATLRKGIFYATMGLMEGKPAMKAQALPIGEFFDWRYGKFAITADYLAQAKANAEKWRSRGALLNLNFDHDPSRPAGRIQIITLEGNGLWVEAELLPEAEEALRIGKYARFSPEWTDMFQDEKGEKYGPMIFGGALTNIPLFATTLDGIYLLEDDRLLKVAAREYTQTNANKERKNEMDADILKDLTGSEDPEEQLAKISEWKKTHEASEAKASEPGASAEKDEKEPADQKPVEDEEKVASADDSGKKAAALQMELAEVNQKVAKMQKEADAKYRSELIERGYREGKITFDQKKKWADAEKCVAFPTNEALEDFIKVAAKVIPDPIGSESDLPAGTSTPTDADRKSAERLNMSVDDYMRLAEGQTKKKAEDRK